jgi:O-glycosyl hydrolase
MNEPLNNQGGYPTMYLDAVDEANLISRALGSLMKDRKVGIWAYDHNTDQPMYPQRVVEGARGQVQAAAWHCYASPANYSVLDDFHYGNPDMLQFMTECSNYKPQSGTYNFSCQCIHAPGSTLGIWSFYVGHGYGRVVWPAFTIWGM